MNQDEILKIIGHLNHPIAMGGYNSDDYDGDCWLEKCRSVSPRL